MLRIFKCFYMSSLVIYLFKSFACFFFKLFVGEVTIIIQSYKLYFRKAGLWLAFDPGMPHGRWELGQSSWVCREVQMVVPGLGCQILSSENMKVWLKFLDYMFWKDEWNYSIRNMWENVLWECADICWDYGMLWRLKPGEKFNLISVSLGHRIEDLLSHY